MKPYYSSENKDFTLYHGDCINVVKNIDISPSLVFADPPYFLSNGGNTVQSGKIVSVDKGCWDRLNENENINQFNLSWLSAVRKIMPKNGTIWISGTFHNIFSIATQLKCLNFRILNAITWEKTNPPPNFTKKFFTHSSEIIIWARKEPNSTHFYNYDLMKKLNDGKQMKDVWKLPAIARWEKKFGKHPTQKPLSVLCRIILAASKPDDIIFDPFCGSSTTGIAAKLLNRRFVGIDTDEEYLKLSMARLKEIDSSSKTFYLKKISGLNSL